jgi:hypothetical protein
MSYKIDPTAFFLGTSTARGMKSADDFEVRYAQGRDVTAIDPTYYPTLAELGAEATGELADKYFRLQDDVAEEQSKLNAIQAANEYQGELNIRFSNQTNERLEGKHQTEEAMRILKQSNEDFMTRYTLNHPLLQDDRTRKYFATERPKIEYKFRTDFSKFMREDIMKRLIVAQATKNQTTRERIDWNTPEQFDGVKISAIESEIGAMIMQTREGINRWYDQETGLEKMTALGFEKELRIWAHRAMQSYATRSPLGDNSGDTVFNYDSVLQKLDQLHYIDGETDKKVVPSPKMLKAVTDFINNKKSIQDIDQKRRMAVFDRDNLLANTQAHIDLLEQIFDYDYQPPAGSIGSMRRSLHNKFDYGHKCLKEGDEGVCLMTKQDKAEIVISEFVNKVHGIDGYPEYDPLKVNNESDRLAAVTAFTDGILNGSYKDAFDSIDINLMVKGRRKLSIYDAFTQDVIAEKDFKSLIDILTDSPEYIVSESATKAFNSRLDEMLTDSNLFTMKDISVKSLGAKGDYLARRSNTYERINALKRNAYKRYRVALQQGRQAYELTNGGENDVFIAAKKDLAKSQEQLREEDREKARAGDPYEKSAKDWDNINNIKNLGYSDTEAGQRQWAMDYNNYLDHIGDGEPTKEGFIKFREGKL